MSPGTKKNENAAFSGRMAVYLDKARNRFGRMIMCHMIADTPEELHGMAEKIGLKRLWFQKKSLPHYDVSLTRRQIALLQGAIECDRRTFAGHLRRLRQRVLRNPEAWGISGSD